ncbi:MAG: hypothetical protein H6903_08605 [Rhodobacteraceae bacterium]|nr:hypothetical protein [Paracoccaceae bacterium]
MIVVSDQFKARIEKLAVKAVAFTAVEGSRRDSPIGFRDRPMACRSPSNILGP